MYSHLTIGTAHVPRAARFYDEVLKPLGLVRRKTSKAGICYAPEGFEGVNEPFWVVRPLDNKEASPGNGVTVAFDAKSRQTVDAFHAAALAAGGVDMARPACARITIRTTTEPMCAILTATRFVPSATPRLVD